jgi:hypothetical protein
VTTPNKLFNSGVSKIDFACVRFLVVLFFIGGVKAEALTGVFLALWLLVRSRGCKVNL